MKVRSDKKEREAVLRFSLLVAAASKVIGTPKGNSSVEETESLRQPPFPFPQLVDGRRDDVCGPRRKIFKIIPFSSSPLKKKGEVETGAEENR